MIGPRALRTLMRSAGLTLCAAALSGCVAAALPVVASGMVAKRAMVGETSPTPLAPALAAQVAETDAVPAKLAIAPYADSVPAVSANLTEAYFRVALFAIERAEHGLSVLPDPGGRAEGELLRPCNDQPSALIVDLDPGDTAFAPQAGTSGAARGLAPALAMARAKGITILWASVLDERRAQDIRTALAGSGLDPAGADQLLLTRDPAETKTERRDAVSDDWCIVAIVGDRMGDFDMLMDYLRDPSAPTPFDPLLGNGWFELPPPLEPAA